MSFQEINAELHAINPGTKILAVSKLQNTAKIRNLFEQGQKLFAENYVQEGIEKKAQLQDLDIEWHFIGHLQKNKIKFVMGQFSLIHSIDTLELAAAIDRRAQAAGVIQKILLQLNLAGEASKGGFSLLEFEQAVPQLQQLRSVEISGLMTMPPLFDDAQKARPYFRQLSEIRKQFVSHFPKMHELSMGTSSDYRVAAEEGATFVRLGTILFGERSRL